MIFTNLIIKYFKPNPLPLATIEAKLFNETKEQYRKGKSEALIDFRAIDISYARKHNFIEKLSSKFPIKYVNIIGVESGQKVPPGKPVTLNIVFRNNKYSNDLKDDISKRSDGENSSASPLHSTSDSISYSSSTWQEE